MSGKSEKKERRRIRKLSNEIKIQGLDQFIVKIYSLGIGKRFGVCVRLFFKRL